jgi:hypothetical protein
MPLNCEFRGSQCSESRTLLKGVRILFMCCSTLVTFCRDDLYVMSSLGRMLISVRIFSIYCWCWVKIDVSGPHIMVLKMCEFCENRHRGDRTSVVGVNGNTFTCAP